MSGAPTGGPAIHSQPHPAAPGGQPALGAGAGIPLRGNDWTPLDRLTPAEPPRVSVIVAHFDQQAELDRTLAALRRQTHPADRTQLIVVDDGSPSAPQVPPGVLLLRQPDLGFRLAAARNLGAASATGDILCFLDADTSPEPGYLSALTRMPALSPDVLAVGRRRHAALAGLPIDAPVELAGPAHELPSPDWLLQAYADSRNLLVSDDRSYRFVIGAVIACSRRLFDRAGGFDETFTDYGGEDWEWAHRSWLAGAVFAHVPEAVAWHDGPEWAGRADDTARRTAKNAETLALARRIPVPGSRPFALRLGAASTPATPADIVVRILSADSLAALVLSVDTVLAALPGARVTVPPPFADALAPDDRLLHPGTVAVSRLVVEVPRPVRFAPGELGRAVARVTAEGLGSLELVTASGAGRAAGSGTATRDAGSDTAASRAPGEACTLAIVTSQRARAREAAWQRYDLFDHVIEPSVSLPITEEPDLAAYFGGWG
ncbi:hypothetical protein B7R54_13835 [Subtercola boreus]|uniref:Glycosyltransferase 2-like domain-containing protein n=1 Tax=Subtercola boreus TaxID=120213 RepID=A0A3E0VL05_9MICO|nr:glycosyltransferase [Subtercola boreus]RFA10168.1 hypothetical protein B7R54_13835 [Subtercola boreus]TQL52668.1 GT2 family glycosyltransferase [Subtercola boreus]